MWPCQFKKESENWPVTSQLNTQNAWRHPCRKWCGITYGSKDPYWLNRVCVLAFITKLYLCLHSESSWITNVGSLFEMNDHLTKSRETVLYSCDHNWLCHLLQWDAFKNSKKVLYLLKWAVNFRLCNISIERY